MIGIWEVVAGLVTILVIIVIRSHWLQNHFKRNGIKNVPTPLPVGGNMLEVFKKKLNFMELIEKTYKAFPDEKYVGFYEFTNKLVVIRDIELLKKMMVKDFDHFVNHRNFIPEDIDPLLGGHLFVLQDQKWRDMRNTLSPAFTGSKMRMMFSLINQYTEKSVKFYKDKAKKQNEIFEIDAKQVYSTYATDIIASCAFGIEANSLEDPENPFFLMGKKMSQFTLKQFFYFLSYSLFPYIMKTFKWKMMSDKDLSFFRTLVQGNMKDREKNGIVRHDMINLLMEAKKGSLKYETSNVLDDAGFATVEESKIGQENTKTKWTDDNLTAQVFLFLVAGFDTTSTLLSFLSLELATHPEIQKRLQDEIDQVKEQLTEELTYSDLQKMKYLDMVVSETLRYWPPAAITDRKCSKSYTLPPANDETGKPYKLNVNDGIWIPIRGIHHDPKYYENPEKFDPERFSDENKHKINPYTYMPFGMGPRNCIGSRFALMEAKAIIFYMLSNFDFVPTSKTQTPIVLKKGSVRMEPENGFWVGLKLRN